MPRADHVLMTADAVGGVWTFALDLARTLAWQDIHVTLAVTGPPPNRAQRDEAAAIPTLTLHTHPARLEWMVDPWQDVAEAGEWLTDLSRRCRPDIIHLNGYAQAALDWDAPVLVTGHSCVLSWWRAVHGELPPAEWDRYAERVNAGLQAADLVTAPTGAMLAELGRYYGPLRRTRVIPNGRTLQPPAAGSAKEPFILTAGRLWDEAKNVAALCDVAEYLAWPVRVAGDTRAPGSGDAVACEGVEYLGRLSSPALASCMERASIYALPARYEPFGLSVLEAARAGCALVLGDIDSLREVWGDAALYAPPNDRHALAARLEALIGNASYRETMAARARRRALAFTAERMADGYLDAYAAL
jgi:glycosyltransferase involved in cell wall biosynthesis